ncbi:MAG: OmpA family protein [Longimicrobiales bacterium]
MSSSTSPSFGKPKRREVFLALCVALGAMIATSVNASAQQIESRWGVKSWEINAFVGGLADAVQYRPDLNDDQFRRDAIFGARVGYTFDSNFFVQMDASNSLLRVVYPDPGFAGGRQARNTNAFIGGGTVGYNFQPRRDFQLYAAVGGGGVMWGAELTQRETQLRLNYGGGLRLFVHPQIALRLDGRLHHIPSALSVLREETAGGPVPDETLYAGEVSLGLSIFTRNSSDSDGDGIDDEDDRCPATRPGAIVDDEGCEIDTDMDGVPDTLDECPGTPRGARVDENGCPSDGDGDGVFDGLDECPGTPAGVDVNDVGCPSDDDGDGVPNQLDECPRTPAGSAVNAQGCSEAELSIEAGRLILHNVYFNFNRSTLRPESEAALNEAAEILLARPDFQVEVQGHTDGIGTDAFNQRLSEARANAILDHLMENFPDLAGRITAVGYGEQQPLATNGTPEGRQENRRVEFVVVGMR